MITNDEFLDHQFHLSMTAGMNQRYHQSYATFWWRWDTSVKVVMAISAVASALFSIATLFPVEPAIASLSATLSVVSAFAAVAMNVIPFGTWEKEHRDFLRQWTDIREDVEALRFACGNDPQEQHRHELQKLDAKIHRICGQEPNPNRQMINKCWDDEKKSRQLVTVPSVA